jgi:hypothetical protein
MLSGKQHRKEHEHGKKPYLGRLYLVKNECSECGSSDLSVSRAPQQQFGSAFLPLVPKISRRALELTRAMIVIGKLKLRCQFRRYMFR